MLAKTVGHRSPQRREVAMPLHAGADDRRQLTGDLLSGHVARRTPPDGVEDAAQPEGRGGSIRATLLAIELVLRDELTDR